MWGISEEFAIVPSKSLYIILFSENAEEKDQEHDL